MYRHNNKLLIIIVLKNLRLGNVAEESENATL